MAVGDVYEVSVIGAQGGKSPTIVMGWKQLVAVTGDEMTHLAQAIETTLSGFVSMWSTGFTWELCKVRMPDDPLVGADVDIEVAGTNSGEALPPQSAAVVAKKTGLIGASRNGRFYIPGLTEGYQAAGLWTESAMTNFNLLGEALRLMDDDDPETWKMVVISKTPTLLVTEVTSCVARSNVGTQRRRRALAS